MPPDARRVEEPVPAGTSLEPGYTSPGKRARDNAHTGRDSRGWTGRDAPLAPAAPAGYRVARARAPQPRGGGDYRPGRGARRRDGGIAQGDWRRRQDGPRRCRTPRHKPAVRG